MAGPSYTYYMDDPKGTVSDNDICGLASVKRPDTRNKLFTTELSVCNKLSDWFALLVQYGF